MCFLLGHIRAEELGQHAAYNATWQFGGRWNITRLDLKIEHRRSRRWSSAWISWGRGTWLSALYRVLARHMAVCLIQGVGEAHGCLPYTGCWRGTWLSALYRVLARHMAVCLIQCVGEAHGCLPYSFIHLPPTLYNVSLPVLQFSPVSIIPSMLHTHSYIYHQRCIMFLSQYFSVPLSVPFHQCSILIHPSTTNAV
jgi:hypothetical protein